MPSFKEHIIITCKNYLEDKIKSLNSMMQEVSDSANAESKSSAGDKHETGRAMMQLEQEKLGNQLKEAEEQLAEFNKIDFSKPSQLITQGSLVETNKGYFFIAGSIGKLIANEKTVFVISYKSPLALAFNAKKQKDVLSFNGVEYVIEKIS